MFGQYFGGQLNNSDKVEGTDKDTSSPVVNSDPFADNVPVDAAFIHEIPVGGTLAPVGPTNETIVHETPVGETIPYNAPVAETITQGTTVVTNPESSTTVFNREESGHFRTRWSEIQGMFVDEPHSAVQQADALVSEVIEQITQKFTNEHSVLKGQWNQGAEASTEDLRKALKSYRSFFNRLVV